MMTTKFEIKKIAGGHKVECFRWDKIKDRDKVFRRMGWIEVDSGKFDGDDSRGAAVEYGREFVRERE
ncbi:MAG: hypothetical protein KAY24_19955 [Candidatus Eisenbacteria sp.]|nr:hypothetical protein [Candidatus Eisenbacteria bacterium]